jgi:hypothetical protein
MPRKNNKQTEPKDPLDRELMKTVKSERALTEIESNRLQQEVINDKLATLREAKRRRLEEAGKKEPEKTFLSDHTVEEVEQTVEELSGKRLDLYVVLLTSLDRIKKLEPKNARRELRTLAKIVPVRDPSEVMKAFSDGFDLGVKSSAQIISSLKAAKSQEESSRLYAEVLKKIVEKADSLNRGDLPMLITLDQYSGSAVAGASVTFVAGVYGCTEPVKLSVKKYPKDATFAWASQTVTYPMPGVQGVISCKLPSSVQRGKYEMIITAEDAKEKTAATTYTLTVP